MHESPVRSDRRQKLQLAAARLALAVGLAFAFAQGAAAEKDSCPTWFPDFRCDRDVRPDGHVAPTTMPYLFEDPYTATDLQFVYIYHDYPENSVFAGGGAHVLALQARVAITEDFAFIATKDGLFIHRPDNEVLGDEERFVDITLGFKYKLYDNRELGLVFTPAVRYEIPTGSRRVYNRYGAGATILSATGGWKYEDWNTMVSLGGYIPSDMERNSSYFFYNFHVSHAFPGIGKFVKNIVPFFEMNGMHYTGSGDGENLIRLANGAEVPVNAVNDLLALANGKNRPQRFEAVDVGNIGSKDVSGRNVVTAGGGVRIPLEYGISFSAAYEGAFERREQDIYQQRFTMAIRYQF